MNEQASTKRVSLIRKLGWLGVASMLALAVLAPNAGSALAAPTSFTGAIWTSLANGGTVNANIYGAKSDVYLNGGPQNCGNSNGLPDGDYYFQVTDPSGATLLSQDAISARQVRVTNGVIAGNGDGTHTEGTSGCNGGLPVQLMPYATTPNNGGEYSVDMGPKADVEDCPGFSSESTTLNFLSCSKTKNDNYKVRLDFAAIAIDKVADPTTVPFGGGVVNYTYSVTNPGDTALSNVTVSDDKCSSVTYVSGDDGNHLLDLTETWLFTCSMFISQPTVNVATAHGWDGDTELTAQATASVDVAPETTTSTSSTSTSISSSTTSTTTTTSTTSRSTSTTGTQGVLAETSAPRTTLPPTDSLSGTAAPSTDSWRILLIAGAALLASVLVLSPARASRRR